MILEMHDICKDYTMGGSIVHILKNIDLTVDENEYLAIMGPSGSGKTTLMNLIGCLDVPTSGSYVFNGHDIPSCSPNELADIRNKDLGFVFQTFHLLPKLSALENAALPLLYGGVRKAERLEMAFEALKTVGLEDRVDFRPDQLSGGQCQRVAIARAIVGKPKLLLADEPTGALDSASGKQVMELFAQLHEAGSTIIMITHDQKIADYAENVKYIYDGVLTGGALYE
ncbi:MAG: ABC transporter ATP-binding protein [Lachnospiraceae bacterium]|nr:ABC transporter ATP-binding protein [Lachnospiraceae bacterium]